MQIFDRLRQMPPGMPSVTRRTLVSDVPGLPVNCGDVVVRRVSREVVIVTWPTSVGGRDVKVPARAGRGVTVEEVIALAWPAVFSDGR